MSDMFAALSAPFPPEAISWRPGSTNKDKTKARALAYLDARDVMQRLDEVCGPGNWQSRYVPMPNGTTCCEIGIHSEREWIWKANGAGNTDIEGEKGGYSDAFKRAAVLWGIGRYLYSLDSPWVRINQWKQIEEDELPRLRALLERNGAPKITAYAARKNGEWDEAMNALKVAIDLGRMAVDDVVREQRPLVAKWPDNWREHYAEAVARAQDKARVVA